MALLVGTTSFDIGDVVRFSSINPKDTRVWQGTVIGVTTYQVAAHYADVINYYQQVKSALDNPNQISLLNQAEFILIDMETESGSIVKPICPEWIDPTTFKKVEEQASYLIQVYTHSGETSADILQLLRDNGFTCKALS